MFKGEHVTDCRVISNIIPGLHLALNAQEHVDADRSATLAQQYYQSGQFDLAVYWAKNAIGINSQPTGHYIYGLCLKDGLAFEQNELLSQEEFQKAANQGHNEARNLLVKL